MTLTAGYSSRPRRKAARVEGTPGRIVMPPADSSDGSLLAHRSSPHYAGYVGGQEDMIIDVALQLVAERERAGA